MQNAPARSGEESGPQLGAALEGQLPHPRTAVHGHRNRASVLGPLLDGYRHTCVYHTHMSTQYVLIHAHIYTYIVQTYLEMCNYMSLAHAYSYTRTHTYHLSWIHRRQASSIIFKISGLGSCLGSWQEGPSKTVVEPSLGCGGFCKSN